MSFESKSGRAVRNVSRGGTVLLVGAAVVFGGAAAVAVTLGWHQTEMSRAAAEAGAELLALQDELTVLEDKHEETIQACSDNIGELVLISAMYEVARQDDRSAVDNFFSSYWFEAGDIDALYDALSDSDGMVQDAVDDLGKRPCGEFW